MLFKRPITWQRVACHLLYWGISSAVTHTQFVRALQDKPNKHLLYLVSGHHCLTTLLSFFVLGYIVIPNIWYRPRSAWDRALLITGALVMYYVFSCVNTYALLTYVNTHFSSLPIYLSRRVELFLKAPWYKYLVDPSILFFIYGQFISYVTTPLLIKAVRDGYVRSQAQLAAEKERRRLEIDHLALEKEHVTKELIFLRQQINPHFLLNAFNNIYALITRKDNRAADTLANLSTLMRYTLYRTGQDFVPLTDELEFIRGYICMEQIRHTQPGVIDCQLPDVVEAMENWLVPPLLLVTFIENAFKHGLHTVYEGGWVQIAIETDLTIQSRLTLTVTNNKSDTVPGQQTDGGIGLANVRRRLALLYPPTDYSLTISEQPDQFGVRLSIPLKPKGESIYHHGNAITMLTH
ncbi:sensor histidine kinase [Fibrella aquatilis]|uniref:Histidine kinase n=1 Tax=Fibrella aquatilis TaxID=2817059 RepID=A0A939JWG4_9BACT|nr:histidine kinase [Fibrella aquatilis]MBO0931882.1 histidine kinase [Fibrella aquatilis]